MTKLTPQERREVIVQWFKQIPNQQLSTRRQWYAGRPLNAPGFSLKALADLLEVSVTTAREDLYRMCENGLLRARTEWNGTAYHTVFSLRREARQNEVQS